jgi:hypothetical protein
VCAPPANKTGTTAQTRASPVLTRLRGVPLPLLPSSSHPQAEDPPKVCGSVMHNGSLVPGPLYVHLAPLTRAVSAHLQVVVTKEDYKIGGRVAAGMDNYFRVTGASHVAHLS